MASMSSQRMLSSYPVAWTALNMDHAQLRFDAATAALQQSSAMHRYRLPEGLPARLFQNLAARKSQTWCSDLRPNSAKRMAELVRRIASHDLAVFMLIALRDRRVALSLHMCREMCQRWYMPSYGDEGVQCMEVALLSTTISMFYCQSACKIVTPKHLKVM